MAWKDTWDFVIGFAWQSLVIAAIITGITIVLSNHEWKEMKDAIVSVGLGVASTAIVFIAVFLVHLLYLTPKHLLFKAESKHEEREANLNAEQTRNTVCLKLSRSLGAGNAILEKCRKHLGVTNEEAEAWASGAEFGVRLAAGEVWSIRFNDISGIPPASPSFPSDERIRDFLAASIAIFNFVYPRCYRLRELIDAIERGTVMPFSKPFGG